MNDAIKKYLDDAKRPVGVLVTRVAGRYTIAWGNSSVLFEQIFHGDTYAEVLEMFERWFSAQQRGSN